MLTAAEIIEWDDGAPARATPLLDVAGLCKQFGGSNGWLRRRSPIVQAVDDVSFAVFKDEVVALVGEAGCGKTTVARLLMQSTRPDRGVIQLDARPLSTTRAALRAYRSQVQLVFADSRATLNPRMAVGTQIALAARGRGMPRRAAAEHAFALLHNVGLDPGRHAACYPHMLSDDQCRRADLARALAVQPRLLVVDEPGTAGDGSQNELAIHRLLLDLRRKHGLTLILLARDPVTVGASADRLIAMHEGRVVESGPADAVLAAPRHPYTAELIAGNARSSLQAPQADPEIGSAPRAGVAAPAGCRYHPRCRYAELVCTGVVPPLAPSGADHSAACLMLESTSGHARAIRPAAADHGKFSRT